MKDNPKAAIDALVTDSTLTLGKVALLCRIDSPILVGSIDSLPESLAAIYVVERPLPELLSRPSTLKEDAIAFYDRLTPEEYRRRLGGVLEQVAAFFEMLPRPSPGSKKNSATDGRPNSPNGSAEPTATASTTSSGNSRRSRPRSSGAAGSRGRAAARPERS